MDYTNEHCAQMDFEVTYNNDDVLGVGSFGTIVYKGVYDNKRVAVKVFPYVFDIKDLETTSSLANKNVIQVLKVKVLTDEKMVALLDIYSKNLEHYLQTKISLKSAERISKQLVDGVNYLHQSEVVHGNLCPSNVLLNDTGQGELLVISDHRMYEFMAPRWKELVKSSNTTGKTEWMAPEILEELQNFDKNWTKLTDSPNVVATYASDVFSVGCLLYFVATNGRHLFGQKFLREDNILKNNPVYDFKSNQPPLFQLVRQMITANPLGRPELANLVSFCWDGSMGSKKMHESKLSVLDANLDKESHYLSFTRNENYLLADKLPLEAEGVAKDHFGKTLDAVKLGKITVDNPEDIIFNILDRIFQFDQPTNIPTQNAQPTQKGSPKPPPLPPPPSFSFRTDSLARGLYPVHAFRQPKSTIHICNQIKQISIDEGDVKTLKNNFPLKSTVESKQGLFGSTAFTKKFHIQEFLSEEKKFLLHIELFLKRYRIQDFQPLLQSIKTLHAENTNAESECFSALFQCIPKPAKMIKIQQGKMSQESVETKTQAEKFATELLNIENLHDKLTCTQFSLDFNEISTKVFTWANKFIKTCNEIRYNDTFVKVIKVIMCLPQYFLDKHGEESQEYFFDIQVLTTFAATKPADNSSTYLHFVVEYMLSKPDLIGSVDFYKAFPNLRDLTKTSIQEITVQCDEWRNTLNAYNAQYEKIRKSSQENSTKMDYATKFSATTGETLEKLVKTLTVAQESFDKCKERFGVYPETTEVTFFKSISQFCVDCQKAYTEIVERIDKSDKKTVAEREVGSQSLPVPDKLLGRREILKNDLGSNEVYDVFHRP